MSQLITDLVMSKAQLDMEDKENIDFLGANLVKNNYVHQNVGKIKGKVLTFVIARNMIQRTLRTRDSFGKNPYLTHFLKS